MFYAYAIMSGSLFHTQKVYTHKHTAIISGVSRGAKGFMFPIEKYGFMIGQSGFQTPEYQHDR